MAGAGKFRFAIDRGGTFTDVFAECPDGSVCDLKLLSEDSGYPNAPREGIRRVLESYTGIPHPRDAPLDYSRIGDIRMGTTVATNALLERQGEPTALAITEGFRDLLQIGNQARPSIFDLAVATPELLYTEVVEVSERVSFKNNGDITSVTGEKLSVVKPLDVNKLRKDLEVVFGKGIKSLAVVLLHGYLYAEHECIVGKIAEEIGFEQVSLSHVVMPMARMVPRGFTTCADAYLTPHIKRYIESFKLGFKDNCKGVNVTFMMSDGGLAETFGGSRAILSGPAGGVVGYAMTAYNEDTKQPVIGFDMGGTSTDVSRYAGTFEHVFETTTAGVTIQAPQLDINTVAAGGGSRLFFRSGQFVVGPESAGAFPGPVCYGRKAGMLAVTDANLLLGRISVEHFPSIFGETEDQPLNAEATRRAFEELTADINSFLATQPVPSKITPEEAALGFIRVANEAMCRPIRSLTQAKGFNTANHVLACFGGAAGQHACSIARLLGMEKIFIHRYSGILSAYGLAAADVVQEAQEPCSGLLNDTSVGHIQERLNALARGAVKELQNQGFQEDAIFVESFLNLRYKGTDCAIMTPTNNRGKVPSKQPHDVAETLGIFIDHHKREFGFSLQGREIIIDDIRVRATGVTKCAPRLPVPHSTASPTAVGSKVIWFDGHPAGLPTPMFKNSDLCHGQSVEGPALLLDKNSTILVEPGCTASMTPAGDIEVIASGSMNRTITTALNAVHLSVFGHRFMSIAEQMGRALQRTSISVNIKERLDFSCALFSPDGGLVANAPHIPVHLGSMQEAVRFQIQHLGSDINRGDVLVANHPAAGGSHLPDITVMTPVFCDNDNYPSDKPIFFVASRGHHADIGGITPGSMPPNSKTLSEEGACIISFKLVKGGEFQEAGITEILMAPGKIEGCSGTRQLNENLSDLKAQVAANQRGIILVNELIEEWGLDVVIAYMNHIQDNSEQAVRDMLKSFVIERTGSPQHVQLHAEDHMDDGSPICLQVDINGHDGSAVFDFTGTGVQVWGNCNTPRSVSYSAVIYCLRSMVGHDIPLNQGCLNPVEIKIPKGSILWPADDAAVVGGNVLTSQRVTDVVLKAFEASAASQGCMNNTTFGNKGFGYYETVAGGAGAGPTWHGRSGVHTHMTNTRITDPEILERRYPVVLQTFTLREGSGGTGQFRGGDGVIREIEFREAMKLSILSERRAFKPYGLSGGGDGALGINHLIRKGHITPRMIILCHLICVHS